MSAKPRFEFDDRVIWRNIFLLLSVLVVVTLVLVVLANLLA